MKPIILPVVAVAILSAAACAPLERSRDLANPQVSATTIAQQVCASCHGVTGVATSPNFPNIAAQQADYTVSQLKGFRGHGRSDPAGFEYMWGLSSHLTDDQIAGLGAYFAAQAAPPPRPAPAGAAALVDAGRDLFQKGATDRNVPPCSACHGDHGQGNAQFPRLAGQHTDYLVKQLMVFQRTDMRPEGAAMKEIAHALTPADIRAVATYLQTEPGS